MKQILRVVGSLLFGYLFVVIGAVVGQDLLLARQGILDNPLWFDVVAGGSVIAGVALGAFLYVSYGKQRLRGFLTPIC